MEGTKKAPGMLIYDKDLRYLLTFPHDELHLFLKAMLDYKNNGVIPELDDSLDSKWELVKEMVDKDMEQYHSNKAARSFGGYKKNHPDALHRDEYDHAKEVLKDLQVLKAYYAYVDECKNNGKHYCTPENFGNLFGLH